MANEDFTPGFIANSEGHGLPDIEWRFNQMRLRRLPWENEYVSEVCTLDTPGYFRGIRDIKLTPKK